MPLSLLIVDDESAICDNLLAFFEDEGIATEVAYSGEQALEKIADGARPDVCIMDLRLPGIDGTKAMLAIRERLPGVRFVVHSGSTQENVATELRRAGLGDVPVFAKPIDDMHRLSVAIQALVAKH